MLALQTSSTQPPPCLTPNLLQTRLSHTGPITISKRYWNPRPVPSSSDKSTSPSTPRKFQSVPQTSYFRGRKLLSRTLRLPEGYKGYIVQKTSNTLTCSPSTTSTSTKDATIHKGNKLPVFPSKLPVLTGSGRTGIDGLEESGDEDEDEDPLRRMMMSAGKPAGQEGDGREEERKAEVETRILEVKGTFDEILVWGHEEVVGDGDAFVKGVEEWMEFARVLHSD